MIVWCRRMKGKKKMYSGLWWIERDDSRRRPKVDPTSSTEYSITEAILPLMTRIVQPLPIQLRDKPEP